MTDLTAARTLADAADKAAEGATEGPWSISAENTVCNQIDGQYHAVCIDQFCYAPEKDANARLIAASRQLVPDMAREIRALCAEVERLRAALIWCSGSADFSDGGIAREGWLKLCKPLLEQPK